MAKKMRPKELRALQEQEKKKKYANQPKSFPAKSVETKGETKEKTEKLSTKSQGLKSVLINEGTVYMTTYEKGNRAKIEKKIQSETIETIGESNFDVEPQKHDFVVKSSRWKRPEKKNVSYLPASTDKIKSTPNTDAIGRKDQLEERYFGKTFNDNIHIQMIYNILDIRKILAVYSNNIVYMFNNMRRIDTKETDLFGDISFRSGIGEKKYEKIFDFPQLAYFGNVFYDIKGNNVSIKKKEDVFAVYQILGTLRQVCSHEKMNKEFKSKYKEEDYYLSETILYNVDDWDPEYKKVLDNFYSSAVEKMNKDFLKNNKKANFSILTAMYPDENLKDYLGEYYDFIVRKNYKNLGFSIKQLRETMYALEFDAIKGTADKKYDSIRSKMNQLFDFALVRYFTEHTQDAKDFVKELRSCSKDDDLKNAVYESKAKLVYSKIESILKRMMSKMDGNTIKSLAKNKDNFNSLTIPAEVGTECSYFSKLIYFVTLFLNGKEINDLVTTLINKFSNIASFYGVLKDLELQNTFTDEYKLFAKADVITQELMTINGFCRMQKAMPDAKKQMYREALVLFGYTGDDIDKYVDGVLCVGEREADVPVSLYENAGLQDIEQIAKAFGAFLPKGRERDKAAKSLLDHFKKADIVENDGQTVRLRMSVKVDNKTGLRNFIASNVIESSRFQYLIKYNNPKTVRDLAQNEGIVKMQLMQLPDSQIDRYYDSCAEIKQSSLDKKAKVQYLAKKITKVDYAYFEDVKQDDRHSSDIDKKEKERYKAVISLYLTVLYLFTKNLVYVNSRYVMAFSCLDRDACLYDIRIDDTSGKNYLELVKKFIGYDDNSQPIMKNKRACRYIKTDIDHTSDKLEKQFRNKVCHLNVIQNAHKYLCDMQIDENAYDQVSYYACYHYCLQRLLVDDCDFCKNMDVAKALETYRWYNKDFVKAICSPFGYNLARFKNLSIEDLFDMNNPKEEKKKKIDFPD